MEQANINLTQHATTIEQLATSQERNRLARELHDTLAHTLSGLAVQLEAMDSIWEEDPQSLKGLLEQALITTREGLGEARRAIQALRASPLDDLGLILALQDMAQAAAERANFSLDLQLPDRIERLGTEVEQGIYRIAEQAITNVTQHANASRLGVKLTVDEGRKTLTIMDDGRGFVPGEIENESHFGLRGMRERAEIIGGILEVMSQPDQGTTVQLKMEEPLDSSIDM